MDIHADSIPIDAAPPVLKALPALLDERAAAQVLCCSVPLMRKMRLYGTGTGYCKIGSLVSYRLGEVHAFIVANSWRGKT
jgi:hypothetical protein